MPKRPDIPRISLTEGKKVFNKIKSKLPFPAYVAGSIKREVPFINDIDIVIIPKNIDEARIVISSILTKIEKFGEQIISGIYYHNNRPVLIDFFVTTKKELPYSMLQYIGPKYYNIRIRRYVRDQHGWLLNQHGLFYANKPTVRVAGTSSIKTEKDIIKFIGTHYYHPREREK